MTDVISVLSSYEHTLAIFLPLPFLCSPGQKAEVKTSLSGSGSISPILPCSCQKIWHPIARFFSLSNKSHTSLKHANLPPSFPVVFMPFSSSSLGTLPPGTGTMSWLVPYSLEPKACQVSLSSSLCCSALWLGTEQNTAAEVKKHPPLSIIWLVLPSIKT